MDLEGHTITGTQGEVREETFGQSIFQRKTVHFNLAQSGHLVETEREHQDNGETYCNTAGTCPS